MDRYYGVPYDDMKVEVNVSDKKNYEYTVTEVTVEEAHEFELYNYMNSHKACAFLIDRKAMRYKKKMVRGGRAIQIDVLGELKIEFNSHKNPNGMITIINIVDLDEIRHL